MTIRYREHAQVGEARRPVADQATRAQRQHPRAEVTGRAGQEQESGVVGEKMQPVELHAEAPADPPVARGTLQRRRREHHQRQPLAAMMGDVAQRLADPRQRTEVVVRLHPGPKPVLVLRRHQVDDHLRQSHQRCDASLFALVQVYQSAGRMSSPVVISLPGFRKPCSTNPPYSGVSERWRAQTNITTMTRTARVDENETGRDFVVGDLHGKHDTLEAMLAEVEFEAALWTQARARNDARSDAKEGVPVDGPIYGVRAVMRSGNSCRMSARPRPPRLQPLRPSAVLDRMASKRQQARGSRSRAGGRTPSAEGRPQFQSGARQDGSGQRWLAQQRGLALRRHRRAAHGTGAERRRPDGCTAWAGDDAQAVPARQRGVHRVRA